MLIILDCQSVRLYNQLDSLIINAKRRQNGKNWTNLLCIR